MKKNLIALVALGLAAFLVVGCDGGSGGPIRPIANKGGAGQGAKSAHGPHPMPGSGTAAAGN